MLIRHRRIKSRAWRRARKKNAPQREQRLLKRKFELQKRLTSAYLGRRKGNWELEMIQKAKMNNKVLWNFVKDISGRTKKRDEKTYIYLEGEKKALEIVWKLFISIWKKEIYQKAPRMDLTFWYGSDKTVGLKEIMRREDAENRANGGSKNDASANNDRRRNYEYNQKTKEWKSRRNRWYKSGNYEVYNKK